MVTHCNSLYKQEVGPLGSVMLKSVHRLLCQLCIEYYDKWTVDPTPVNMYNAGKE